MKVIFLDFDGVINNWDHFDGVDYKNVVHLLEIIKATGVKIVATTSNKYSFQRNSSVDYRKTDFYRYITKLDYFGVKIFDVTPYVNADRELEIIEYLNRHPDIEQFVILDDDIIIHSLKEHQVFLDLYKGLNFEHIQPSVDILNGKLGFYPKEFNINESSEDRLIRIHKYYAKKK